MRPEDLRILVLERSLTLTQLMKDVIGETGRIKVGGEGEYVKVLPATERVIPLESLESGLSRGETGPGPPGRGACGCRIPEGRTF